MMTVDTGDLKLACYVIPKVGKTALKSTMRKISDHSGGSYVNYGDKPFTRKMKKRGEGHYRFCVVRDPVDRLVSCYADRVADRDDIRRSSISVVLCKLLGLDPSPSLNDFVLNLHKYYLINDRIFRHTICQHRYLGRNPGFYDVIYPIKKMGELNKHLSDKVGFEIEVVKRNASKAKVSREDLSPEALNYLKRFYRKDYEIYGQFFNS